MLLLAKKIFLLLIKWYQKTISPDHGVFSSLHPYGYCRYFPTCSEYTRQAIEKHGLISGSLKGLKRLVRCNPLSKGGLDPLG